MIVRAATKKSWHCWIFVLMAYSAITKGFAARCVHFPAPLLLLFTSWMRHPLKNERNVLSTSLVFRKDTEP